MTDESAGDVITEFVSGGAKNYAYVTRGIDDEHPSKTVCKVQGFTLNVRGMEVLNFESVKNNIIAKLARPDEEREPLSVVNLTYFHRDGAEEVRAGL